MGSNGKAHQHGAPPEDMECLACMEDIDMNLYVEYRAEESGPWLSSKFCKDCIAHLLATQWGTYEKQLASASCKAEQRRLLRRGPPINIRDVNALPCPDDGEVVSLWFGCDGLEHSAKLDGSLTGDARQVWWDEKLAFEFDEPDDEQQEATQDAQK